MKPILFALVSILLSWTTGNASIGCERPYRVESIRQKSPAGNRLTHLEVIDCKLLGGETRHRVATYVEILKAGKVQKTYRIQDGVRKEVQVVSKLSPVQAEAFLDNLVSNTDILSETLKESGNDVVDKTRFISATIQVLLFYAELFEKIDREMAPLETLLNTISLRTAEARLLSQKLSNVYELLLVELEENAPKRVVMAFGLDALLSTVAFTKLMNVFAKGLGQLLTKMNLAFVAKGFTKIYSAISGLASKWVANMSTWAHRFTPTFAGWGDDLASAIARSVGAVFHRLTLAKTAALDFYWRLKIAERLAAHPKMANFFEKYAPVHHAFTAESLSALKRNLAWSLSTNIISQKISMGDEFWKRWDQVLQDQFFLVLFNFVYSPWNIRAPGAGGSVLLGNQAYSMLDGVATYSRLSIHEKNGSPVDADATAVSRYQYNSLYYFTSGHLVSSGGQENMRMLRQVKAGLSPVQAEVVDAVFRAVRSVIVTSATLWRREAVAPQQAPDGRKLTEKERKDALKTLFVAAAELREYPAHRIQPGLTFMASH